MDKTYNNIHLEDIQEPYNALTEILTFDEIILLSNKIKGVEINFKNKEIKEIKSTLGFKLIKNCLGEDLAFKIYEIYRGDKVYFPSMRKALSITIKNEIKKEYTEYNLKELACKWGYSERQIRRIIEK